MENYLNIAMVAACPFPYPRGTPVRIYRLAEALCRRGHTVHVVTYHLGEKQNASDMVIHRIRDIKSYRKVSPGPSYSKLAVLDPLLAFKLSEVLRNNAIDVVHAHHYEGLLVSALARVRRRVPLIYDAHTMMVSELPYYGLGLPSGFKRFLGRSLDRLMPRRSDYVLCVTDRIRRSLVEECGLPPDKAVVVSNGVECEIFDVNHYSTVHTALDYKKLIFTGNLSPYQGIDLLLKAFQRVLSERSDVRLVIVSDSPLGDYERLAGKLGIRQSIDIVPSKFERLPMYLAEADIALNPRTECDGIPQKLLNYMAASKPIVSFTSSAPVLEHGRTGWIVQDGDVSAFADGVLRLLADAALASQLGKNARKYVLSNHTWDRAAEQAETAYRRVLSNRFGAQFAEL